MASPERAASGVCVSRPPSPPLDTQEQEQHNRRREKWPTLQQFKNAALFDTKFQLSGHLFWNVIEIGAKFKFSEN